MSWLVDLQENEVESSSISAVLVVLELPGRICLIKGEKLKTVMSKLTVSFAGRVQR